MPRVEPGFLRYSFTDKTKFAVVEFAPLTATGMNEVRAAFDKKADAVAFARAKWGRNWRSIVAILDKRTLRKDKA